MIRTFPIRVSGDSGPLPHEIDWETVTLESASGSPLIEYTSVTRQVRRVARFDADIVRKAIVHNNPTRIVLNHVDYLDRERDLNEDLSSKSMRFVERVEGSIERDIDYVGLSPSRLFSRKMVTGAKRAASASGGI